MALRKLVLDQIITPQDAVDFVEGKFDELQYKIDVDVYRDAGFCMVPELLNYLRNSTLHIVENGAAESPTTTPSFKGVAQPQKPTQSARPKTASGRAKRRDLFGAEDVGHNQASHWDKQNTGNQQTHDATSSINVNQQKTDKNFNKLDKSGHTPEHFDASDKQTAVQAKNRRDTSGSFLSDEPHRLTESFSSFCDESVVSCSSEAKESSYADCLSSSGSKPRSSGKNGKQFPSPNAQSTPNAGRKGRARQSMALGDFLNFSSLDKTGGTDTSSEVCPVPRRGKKGKKGKKGRKENGAGNAKLADTSSESHNISMSLSSFEDFPPVSPGFSPKVLDPNSRPSDEVDARLRRKSAEIRNQPQTRESQKMRTYSGTELVGNIPHRTEVSRTSENAAGCAQDTEGTDADAQNPGEGTSRNSRGIAADRQGTSRCITTPGTATDAQNPGHDTDQTPIPPSPFTPMEAFLAEQWTPASDKATPVEDWPRTPVKISPVKDLALTPIQRSPADSWATTPVRSNLTATPVMYSEDFPALSVTVSPRVSALSESDHDWETGMKQMKHSDEDRASTRTMTAGADGVSPVLSLADDGDHTPALLARRSRAMITPVKINPAATSDPGFGQEEEDQGSGTVEGFGNLVTSPVKQFTPDKFKFKGYNLVTASPGDVTHREELDLYIQLYSSSLDAHLVPSLSTEIYFLGQLLIAQSSVGECPVNQDHLAVEERNYFMTLHNVVYFAVGVLHKQIQLLKKFDKLTLQLLSENRRVQYFCPELHDELKTLCDNLEDTANSSSQSAVSTFQVTFQVETDNRTNFPSDESFHQSKKQRDMFAELLKLWDERNGSIDWTVPRLRRQIQDMFEGAGLACYIHFSRLFISHLFATCQQDQLDGTDFSFTSLCPDKSLKLTERLTKRSSTSSCGGPCPAAVFAGKQRFFVEFVKAASNPALNRHLSDMLATQIHELNSQEFGDKTKDSSGQSGLQGSAHKDQKAKSECDNFGSTLQTLRLLARFLGFITFLPYQGSEKLPHSLRFEGVARRRLTRLPVDLGYYVSHAERNDGLALTIPWVVEFLGMMDGAAPSTSPLQGVLAQLRCLLKLTGGGLKRCGFGYSRLLVVACLGWLFDQPCLLDYYFNGDPSSDVYDDPAPDIAAHMEKWFQKELVTRDLFYSCCPYFGEIRYLLTEYSLGSRAKTQPRKVNPRPPAPAPSTTKKQDLKLVSKTKDIQVQLLKSFFRHLFPKWAHHVMSMVSEMVSHNFIKYLKLHVMPSALDRCTAQDSMMSAVPETASRLFTETRDSMVSEMNDYCKLHVEVVVQMLLPPGTAPSTVNFAVSVALIQTKKRIMQWMKRFVTYNAFHLRMEAAVEMRMRRIAAGKEPPPGQTTSPQCKDNNSSSLSPGESRPEKTPSKLETLAAVHPNFVRLPSVDGNCTYVVHRTKSEDFELKPCVRDITQCGCVCGCECGCCGPSRTGSCVCSVTSPRLSVMHVPPYDLQTALLHNVTNSGDNISKLARLATLMSTSEETGSVSSCVEYSDLSVPSVQTGSSSGTDLSSRICRVSSSTSLPRTESSGHKGTDLGKPSANQAQRGSGLRTVSLNQAQRGTSLRTVSVNQAQRGTNLGKAPANQTHPVESECKVTRTESSTPCASVAAAATQKAVVAGTELRGSVTDTVVCQTLPGTADIEAESGWDGNSFQMTLQERMEGGEMVFMLRETQDLLLKLTVYRDDIKKQDVTTLLHCVLNVLSRGDELFPYTLDSVMTGMAHLAAAIVFRQPSLWSGEITVLYLRLWQTVGGELSDLMSLCTVVGLGYLREACDLPLSLSLYRQLLKDLIGHGLISLNQISAAFSEVVSDDKVFQTSIQALLGDLARQV